MGYLEGVNVGVVYKTAFKSYLEECLNNSDV